MEFFHVPIVLKSGNLNLLEASGPAQTCNGIALPFNVRVAVGEKSWALHDQEWSEVCPRDTRCVEATRVYPNKANQHTY